MRIRGNDRRKGGTCLRFLACSALNAADIKLRLSRVSTLGILLNERLENVHGGFGVARVLIRLTKLKNGALDEFRLGVSADQPLIIIDGVGKLT